MVGVFHAPESVVNANRLLLRHAGVGLLTAGGRCSGGVGCLKMQWIPQRISEEIQGPTQPGERKRIC